MKLPALFKLNPITRKRLQRFRQRKRAYWSFWLITIIYLLSLVAEFWVNGVPLYVSFEGDSYYPAFKNLVGEVYADDIFTGSGLQTRTDYKLLATSSTFTGNPDNYMIWPLVRSGPHEIFTDAKLDLSDDVTVTFTPDTHVGRVNLDSSDTIIRALGAQWFFNEALGEPPPAPEADEAADDAQDAAEAPADQPPAPETAEPLDPVGLTFTTYYPIPGAMRQAMQRRFSNLEAPAYSRVVSNDAGTEVELQLSPYRPRSEPPNSVRISMREVAEATQRQQVVFNQAGEIIRGADSSRWQAASQAQRDEIREAVATRAEGSMVGDKYMIIEGGRLRVTFFKEDFRVPFRPVQGHWLGLDHSGRDVFARIIYGLRIAMSFGLLLVTFTMIIGIFIGAVQGYYGGLFDITAQRLIEIWSAIPFLYVMILLGSIYGQSFMLLLGIYGVFHWIGISYYMRAEFLKLRKEPFVEAAKCLGIPTWKILFKHILPNGLVPVITFFPFSLVGAIGMLTALDFLGFGLPPGTPSWGNLLSQAQEYSYAWWLVLYPFLILFITILLCVFVGEGVRAAFDPRRHARME